MNHSAINWLYQVTGKYKINVGILLVMQGLLGISSVIFAMLLRSVIDYAAGQNRQGFCGALAVLACLVILQISLRAVVRYLEELSRTSVENALKARLFGNLMRKDYASVTATHSGEWLNRLTSDTVVCANGMVEILPGAAGMLVKMTGALVMLLVLEPRFAYILVPGGIGLVFLTYAFRKVLKKLHKNVQEKDGGLRVFLQERLGSLLIVRTFAAERQTELEAQEKMDAHKSARMGKIRFSNLCNIGFAGAMNGMYLLGLGYCGYGILLGKISYGTLTAILQLVSQIQSPFANITGYLPKFYAMTASAERLMEVEQFPDDWGAGAIDKENIHKFYEREFSAIAFENATFRYRTEEENDLLQNVSLNIKKGEYVALTGHSGCGKSTLFQLMMCLYPLDSGVRYLEKTDGTRVPLDGRYIRLFAYVPQGNHLMSGTIREIVTFGDTPQGDEAIWSALEIACGDGFVRELPAGLDTQLGERGTGLSEGQMQRLAIARAIYSDNPILMLDEATSALDEQTEKKLIANLRAMTDKTVLTVTHRQAILSICDRQVRMTENGGISEQEPEGGCL